MAAPVGTSERLIANERLETPGSESPLAQLASALVLSSVVTLLLVALWFLVRRAAGQLQRPLGLPTLVSVALALVALASLARLVWLRQGIRPTPWKSSAALLWLSLSCGVWLLAGTLTITGTGTLALLLFWSIVLTHEGIWCWLLWHPDSWPPFRRVLAPFHRVLAPFHRVLAPFHRVLAPFHRVLAPLHRVLAPLHRVLAPLHRAFDPRDAAAPMAAPTFASSAMAGEPAEVAGIESLVEGDDLLPLDVCQQLTRVRAEEDTDSVAGLLRAQFSPQQRSHSLHVAFCPPMVRRPKVAVVQLKGPRARIKAAEVQPFGIRFDLRLVTASPTQQDVVIHFEASCAETAPAGSQDANV